MHTSYHRLGLTFTLALAMVLSLLAPTALASHITEPDGTVTWAGQGLDSENCDMDDRPETGWIHWVLTAGGQTDIVDAQIRINTTDVYHRDPPFEATVAHFITPYYNLSDPANLPTAVAEYMGTVGDNAQLVISDFCSIVPSTTLDLDTSGLDVAGVSSYDPVTNTLTVYADSSVTLDATETNDGTVDLTDVYVEFFGVTCLNVGGNLQPTPATSLLAGEFVDVECTFTAPEGNTLVELIGHGTYDGKDVTHCEDPANPDANTICDQDEYASITIVGINPSTDLDLGITTPTATLTGTNPTRYAINVDYGGSVDLSFVELNDGDETLTNVHITFINGAPECVDTAGGVTLDPTDTHTVTCDTITNITAHRTITATGHGTDALGNDVTYCDDPLNAPAGVVCDQDERVIVDIIVNFGEGCTPGLWGQYDNMLGSGRNARYHWIRAEWAETPYSFTDNAGTTFGVSVWDPYTLGELTNRGGGGEAALGRAASAALQNILHPDISYFGYPTGQVGADMLIAEVQDAFAEGGSAIEMLKDKLDDLNNEGTCTLANS